MAQANSLNIRVHEFFQKSDPVKDDKGRDTGEVIVRDYVKYGPPLMMDRQATVARVDRLLRVRRPVEGSRNVHETTAWERAEFIRPLYEAWRRGEELPDDGTPIAVLNFLRPEDVAALKRSAIRSVEELATLPDSIIDRVPLPAMKDKRRQAALWLQAQDTNKAAAEMKRRDDEISELKAQMAELLAARGDEPEVDENGDRIPRKRGRPPKVSHETEAA